MESLITESDFLIKYWSAKVDLINKIQHSKKYNSITIIDNDRIICTMLDELRFTVNRSQIRQFQKQLFIHFTPFKEYVISHQSEGVGIYS